MLEHVENILREYSNRKEIQKNSPIDIKFLRETIETFPNIDKIYIRKLIDFSSDILFSKIQRGHEMTSYGETEIDVAYIYYAKSLNNCWKRFSITKEMIHCSIDMDDKSKSSNTDKLGSTLNLLASDTSVVTGENPRHKSEKMAEFLAVEILFPFKFRKCYIDNPPNEQEIKQLAKSYEIPVYYVEIACRKELVGFLNRSYSQEDCTETLNS